MADVHETPFSTSYCHESGRGVCTFVQLVPFHQADIVRFARRLLRYTPTAMHAFAWAHETPYNSLSLGDGVGSIVQLEPSQPSAKVVLPRQEQSPTAVHAVLDRQETLVRMSAPG